MKQLKYINSRNEAIDFRNFNTQIFQGNFHTYEWTYDSASQRFGEAVERFTKESIKYEMIVAVRGNQITKANNLNAITDITEYDVINKKPGKLWWGDYYLNCYIISAMTEPSEIFFGAEKTMGIFSPHPFWIRESTRSFLPSSSGKSSGEYLDYAYDYDYDYTGDGGNASWNIDHYASSHFEMIIYGPCIDPRINIAGHPYEVFDTVEKGEYIKVSSRDNTVIKYRNNGTTADLFNYRGIINSVFEPIPGGSIPVSWNGSFGFDITLFLERSEPAW